MLKSLTGAVALISVCAILGTAPASAKPAAKAAASAKAGTPKPTPAATNPTPAPPKPDVLTLAEQRQLQGYLGAALTKDAFGSVKIVELDPVGPLAALGMKKGDTLRRALTYTGVQPDGRTLITETTIFDSPQAVRAWLGKFGRGTYHFLTYIPLDDTGSGTSQEAKIFLDLAPDPTPLKPIAASAGDAADLPPLVGPLSAALKREPPRPSAEETAALAEQWGVLAKLAPRVYTTRLIDEQGLYADVCTTFMSNVGCTVTIWWHRPGRVLARSWYTDYGALIATDAITPTATAGIFQVHRRYAGTAQTAEYEIVVTRDQLVEGGTRYTLVANPFATSTLIGDDAPDYLLGDVESRGLQPQKRSEAVRSAAQIVGHMNDMRANAERERRQAQRAEAMAAIYQGLQAASQIVDQSRLQSEANLNATIARAQAQGVGGQMRQRLDAQQQALAMARRQSAGDANPPAAAGQPARQVAQATGSNPSAQTRTSAAGPVRYYFWVGLTPGPNNTRNPNCYSNVLTANVDRQAPDRREQAMRQAQAYQARFIEKCGRVGRVSGAGEPDFEGFNPTWQAPSPHAEDKVVQLP